MLEATSKRDAYYEKSYVIRKMLIISKFRNTRENATLDYSHL